MMRPQTAKSRRRDFGGNVRPLTAHRRVSVEGCERKLPMTLVRPQSCGHKRHEIVPSNASFRLKQTQRITQAQRSVNNGLLFMQFSDCHTSKGKKLLRPESAPMGRHDFAHLRSPTKSKEETKTLQRPMTGITRKGQASSGLTRYLTKIHNQSVPDDEVSREEKREEHCSMVYVWGNNQYGQCGKPAKNENISDPVPVLKGLDIDHQADLLDVASGDNFSVVVCKNGQSYVWGSVYTNEGTVALPPTKLNVPHGLGASKAKVVQVACGKAHGVGLLDSGQCIGWGKADRGQLGRTPVSMKASQDSLNGFSGVRFLDSFIEKRIIGVYCGQDYTIVVASDGGVYGVGDSKSGQLGHGKFESNIVDPVKMLLPSQERVSQIACGSQHTILLLASGDIMGCGNCGLIASSTMPGAGLSQPQLLDTQVLKRNGQAITSIAAGGNRNLVVTRYGQLYTWQARSKEMQLCTVLWKRGVRVCNASIGPTGKVVAVSFTSNVYFWRVYRQEDEPQVLKYFFANGVRVKVASCGSFHMLACRGQAKGKLEYAHKQDETPISPKSTKTSGPLLAAKDTSNQALTIKELREKVAASAPAPKPQVVKCCVKKCIAWGSSLKTVSAGDSRCLFQLQLKSDNGDKFDAPPQSVRITIQDGPRTYNAFAHRKGKGLFGCAYSADNFRVAGSSFVVNVTVDGEHVPKSPFRVLVQSLPASLKHSELGVSYDSKAPLFSISMIAKDIYGNETKDVSPSKTWAIHTIDESGQTLQRFKDGQLSRLALVSGAKFVVVEPGKRSQETCTRQRILLETLDPNAPFSVSLGQTYSSPGETVTCSVVSKANQNCKDFEITFELYDQDGNVIGASCSNTLQLPKDLISREYLIGGYLTWHAVKYPLVKACLGVLQASAVSLLTQRHIPETVKVEDGFMCPLSEWGEKIFGASEVLRIDASQDAVLQDMLKYIESICQHIPANGVRVSIFASVLGDFLNNLNNTNSPGVSRYFARDNTHHNLVRALLFKHLCDKWDISCKLFEYESQWKCLLDGGVCIDLQSPTHKLTSFCNYLF